MKERYKPKIGDEFEVARVDTSYSSRWSPGAIREMTRSVIAIGTLAVCAIVLLISWGHGLFTNNYIALQISVPTVVSVSTFIFMWYFGKPENPDEENKSNGNKKSPG
jgi:hypothetical protein